MKHSLLTAALVLGGLAMTGCVGLTQNNGFPSAPAGVIVADMKVASMVQERDPGRAYKVVKEKVTASAESVCYLMLVSQGDVSYATLKRKALEGLDADDVINLEVDYQHNNLLGIINKVTTTITGTAIKYK